MYEYLWHVSNNSQFATSILQILVKYRRTVHRERWNQNWSSPNLKPTVKLNPNSKYNQNQKLGKLQNSHIDFGEPSRSKPYLATIPMISISIIIQHLVYINTKWVSYISCHKLLFITNLLTFWKPNYSTNQTPPLFTYIRKFETFNYIMTTSSSLIHHTSFNLQDTAHPTLFMIKLSSHLPHSKACSQISNNFVMQKTLPHALWRKSLLPLLASPICRFRSPNTSYF